GVPHPRPARPGRYGPRSRGTAAPAVYAGPMPEPLAVLVEPWRNEDRDAILALHREAGWRAQEVLGEVLVARLDGRVVGAVHLLGYPPDEILVGAIVVGRRWRGRGIGGALP